MEEKMSPRRRHQKQLRWQSKWARLASSKMARHQNSGRRDGPPLAFLLALYGLAAAAALSHLILALEASGDRAESGRQLRASGFHEHEHQHQQLPEIGPTSSGQQQHLKVMAISRQQSKVALPHQQANQLLASASSLVRQQSSSSNNNNNNNQSPDAPKLIPLSALDRYQEGSDLRLFCSASAPPTGGRLQFEWRKNQQELRGQQQQRAQISMMDESASVLRIGQLEAEDSANYTCLVRNQFGQDASTVRINVNVRLKWIVEPAGEVKTRAGKFLQLECDASGQPAPLISWTSLKDRQTINSKVLRIDRPTVNDSGLYECRAVSPLALQSNHHLGGLQQQQPQGSSSFDNGEQLRKIVRVIINGK